jgi:ATP diphosphatase
MTDAGKKTIADLVAVMAALRTPVTGCPWDLEQSYETIAPYTIEEAYEVADAIERGDRVDLQEELGDLLLQVVYHSRLAEEEGAFSFADVVDGITRKMVRRHPHVFGDATARSAGMAKGMWETIKAEEKADKARRKAAAAWEGLLPLTAPADDTKRGVSVPEPAMVTRGWDGAPDAMTSQVLADVPRALPALTRAFKLQEKAARVGFDWPSIAPVFDKVREEVAELEVATGLAAVSTQPASQAAVQEELGDLLFVMANLARHLKIDPEEALRRANAKFKRRFAYVEARLAEEGRTPEQSTLAEMDALWDEIRARDKQV